jgi:hypothetical protein
MESHAQPLAVDLSPRRHRRTATGPTVAEVASPLAMLLSSAIESAPDPVVRMKSNMANGRPSWPCYSAEPGIWRHWRTAQGKPGAPQGRVLVVAWLHSLQAIREIHAISSLRRSRAGRRASRALSVLHVRRRLPAKEVAAVAGWQGTGIPSRQAQSQACLAPSGVPCQVACQRVSTGRGPREPADALSVVIRPHECGHYQPLGVCVHCLRAQCNRRSAFLG